MGIKVGMCGCGAFARNFIPLFKAHPLVDHVVLCDLDAKKLAAAAETFGLADTCPSLDELCQTDVDAVVIITQHWLHAPQAMQALRSGKHVYSAVPSAVSLAEITELVRTVEQTQRIYMVGETSYYYPCAIYCRQRMAQGDFGRIVYGEAEYYHDFDHGLYDVCKWRGGADWKKYAGTPPMYYPTHSTSMIISVTGAHMTGVSCLGWVDRHEDGLFRPGVNVWDNEFSNESALFGMSDGSIARINEFRRVGHPGTVRMSLHGTAASYEEQSSSQAWCDKSGAVVSLGDMLAPVGIPALDEGLMGKVTAADGTHQGVAKVHPVQRLPREFIGLPNGHLGSHQFLVDDFVCACVSGQQPPNNAWQAARYVIPGLVAHDSACQGGKRLPVPDLGDGPRE